MVTIEVDEKKVKEPESPLDSEDIKTQSAQAKDENDEKFDKVL